MKSWFPSTPPVVVAEAAAAPPSFSASTFHPTSGGIFLSAAATTAAMEKRAYSSMGMESTGEAAEEAAAAAVVAERTVFQRRLRNLRLIRSSTIRGRIFHDWNRPGVTTGQEKARNRKKETTGNSELRSSARIFLRRRRSSWRLNQSRSSALGGCPSRRRSSWGSRTPPLTSNPLHHCRSHGGRSGEEEEEDGAPASQTPAEGEPVLRRRLDWSSASCPGKGTLRRRRRRNRRRSSGRRRRWRSGPERGGDRRTCSLSR